MGRAGWNVVPTIALVDDDRHILTSVSIAFEAEGYRTQTYHDGVSALAAMQTSPPDIAILDVKMPRMDGLELLRRLRQTSELPVIFLTSKEDEIDELWGLKMGADDYIRKPFSQRRAHGTGEGASAPGAGNGCARRRKFRAARHRARASSSITPERYACTWNSNPVTLTVTEFLILQALARPARCRDEQGRPD